MLERGWRAHYTNRRYGWGLLPESFESYKKQRHRWAYGGVQIIRKHWRRFLPGGSLLTARQKLEFIVGWIGWLGAESLGVIVALLISFGCRLSLSPASPFLSASSQCRSSRHFSSRSCIS